MAKASKKPTATPEAEAKPAPARKAAAKAKAAAAAPALGRSGLAKPARAKKAAAVTEPRGLSATETRAAPPPAVAELCRSIESDGGAALVAYREPLGGHWVVLAALPAEQLAPTPYQRGLSDTHFKRLAAAIDKVGRFLDPVIAVRVGAKAYQTPNGHHRASAMKLLGASAITALVVTEPEVARLILALNVEKAHNLKEKCEEVAKLAQELARLDSAAGSARVLKETELALELEEPSFLTLGLCYQERPRFAGSTYYSVLKRADAFRDLPLAESLTARHAEAVKLLAIDDRVTELVAQLKAAGMDSPYLKAFVVARINPFRSLKRGAELSVGDCLDQAQAAADAFDAAKVSTADVARTGGFGGGDEE